MITYPTVGGLQGVTVGDSVAVDGICLTVTHLIPEGFVADVSAETLARSTLGQHQEMVTVNLEAALVVGDRLGGHFVTGHVDGMGCLEETSAAATGWEMSFTAPPPPASLPDFEGGWLTLPIAKARGFTGSPY